MSVLRATVIRREHFDAQGCAWLPSFQPRDARADSVDMSRWRTFVDVLDEILSDRDPVPVTKARPAAGIASTPIYAYASRPAHDVAWSSQGAASRAAHYRNVGARPAPSRWSPPEPSASLRLRQLQPLEESALHTLVRLGAAIDRNFTTRELRSHFRVLAQRYHPDRHPQATDAERERLGAAFAELTAAYGVLQHAAN